MLEGLLVFALLAGVLLGCVLLGQWGVHLQYAQMGARLLAFDAGDVFLAKFGRTGDEAVQTFTRDSVSWSAYSSTLPAAWLGLLLDSLPNDRYAGSVRGTRRGRSRSCHAAGTDRVSSRCVSTSIRTGATSTGP